MTQENQQDPSLEIEVLKSFVKVNPPVSWKIEGSYVVYSDPLLRFNI